MKRKLLMVAAAVSVASLVGACQYPPVACGSRTDPLCLEPIVATSDFEVAAAADRAAAASAKQADNAQPSLTNLARSAADAAAIDAENRVTWFRDTLNSVPNEDQFAGRVAAIQAYAETAVLSAVQADAIVAKDQACLAEDTNGPDCPKPITAKAPPSSAAQETAVADADIAARVFRDASDAEKRLSDANGKEPPCANGSNTEQDCDAEWAQNAVQAAVDAADATSNLNTMLASNKTTGSGAGAQSVATAPHRQNTPPAPGKIVMNATVPPGYSFQIQSSPAGSSIAQIAPNAGAPPAGTSPYIPALQAMYDKAEAECLYYKSRHMRNYENEILGLNVVDSLVSAVTEGLVPVTAVAGAVLSVVPVVGGSASSALANGAPVSNYAVTTNEMYTMYGDFSKNQNLDRSTLQAFKDAMEHICFSRLNYIAAASSTQPSGAAASKTPSGATPSVQ